MNVLVLGSGAREHAIARRLSESRTVNLLLVAPGNALIASEQQTCALNPVDGAAVVDLCRSKKIDFVVVGPEAPLMTGIVDHLQQAGIAALGPSQVAARLEGSKNYAKAAMTEAGVRTASYASFTDEQLALDWVSQHPGPQVVKADGLMAGKGVLMCDDEQTAVAALRELFGQGQRRVVIEEQLAGPEGSLIALCDGENYRVFPLARDYKRIGTGDVGKNTGGMGALTPLAGFDNQALGEVAIAPILRYQAARGAPFRGFLFAGLLFNRASGQNGQLPRHPHVLEYNVRFGDPEAQVLLSSNSTDWLELFYGAAVGKLSTHSVLEPVGAAVGVVLAAGGYPDQPLLGAAIEGLERAASLPHVSVFGAGVSGERGAYRVAGGRVVTVVGQGATVALARERAYAAADEIHFSGQQRREDIAG